MTMLRNIRLLPFCSRFSYCSSSGTCSTKNVRNFVSSSRLYSAALVSSVSQSHERSRTFKSAHNEQRIVQNRTAVLFSALNSHTVLRNHGMLHSSVRYASSSTAATTSTPAASQTSGYVFPDGFIPEPPLPPEIVNVVPQLNALGEPTLGSLGLGGWWPTGLFQQGLEALHVSLGIPWWGSIVLATVAIRLCIFPLVIKSQKYMANMNNHMPVIQRLQERVTMARISGNQMEAMQATYELHDYTKRNNVNFLRSFMMPMIQMPIFLSVFFGLRAMAELPVESMRTGGALWFTDLTVPDMYWGLPILTSLTLFATLELGSDSVRTGAMTPVMRIIMRTMPVIVFFFSLNFPSAMCLYWFTSNIVSLVQASILRIPKVRMYFGIPELVKHPSNFGGGPKKGFISGFKESLDNSKLLAKVQDRERIEATKFREAGMGPIQKTYSYDPTKVKKTSQGQGQPSKSASTGTAEKAASSHKK